MHYMIKHRQKNAEATVKRNIQSRNPGTVTSCKEHSKRNIENIYHKNHVILVNLCTIGEKYVIECHLNDFILNNFTKFQNFPNTISCDGYHSNGTICKQEPRLRGII